MKPHAVVIGAGLVGLCTALRLQEQGFKLTLIDRNAPGLGASFGNAGFMATEAVDPLATADTIRRAPKWLADRYGALALPAANWPQSLPWLKRFVEAAHPEKVFAARRALSHLVSEAIPAWKRLLNDTGLSDHLVAAFYMRIWEQAGLEKQARAEQAFYQQWNIEAEFINQAEVAGLQPSLANTVHHAVLLPHAYRVRDPYALSQALADVLQGRGAKIIREEVVLIGHDGGQVKIKTNTAMHAADKAVLCAGAYSAELLRPLGYRVPLMAERGYHLTLKQQQSLLNGPVCSAERNVFLSPLDCGLRITGFSELGGTRLPAYQQRYAVLRHHLKALLPQSDVRAASEWMGMRPTLPDSLPVIDVCSNLPVLGVAFGHQHLGLTLAALTAEMVCIRLLYAKKASDMDAYRLSRFD